MTSSTAKESLTTRSLQNWCSGSLCTDHCYNEISMEIFYRRWGLKPQAIDRVPSHFVVDTLPEDMFWCKTRVFTPLSLAEEAKQNLAEEAKQNGQRACNYRKTRRKEASERERFLFPKWGRNQKTRRDETRKERPLTNRNRSRRTRLTDSARDYRRLSRSTTHLAFLPHALLPFHEAPKPHFIAEKHFAR